MNSLQVLLVLGPILLLLATGLIPSRMADQHRTRYRQWVSWLSGGQFVTALLAAILGISQLFASGSASTIHYRWTDNSLLSVSVHYDGLASLMLLLVAFVGFVVCRFSIRYLDGESRQGRYFRWVGVTIGAVSLLVVSGNLLLFFAAWVLTSLGLHRLLLHYPERPAARRAAWAKFAISRIGDCFLVAAIVLVFREFGTFEFDQLFAAAKQTSPSPAATAIAWLLMLGAVTKSAQFPFHTWLPETMETPTPVSALMHAGIVNAGGYLVIRLSPLIVQAPAALATLAAIGTVTVCFAALVMLTQTSIKRSLAYSTIAQMGFMMLQCGLGAFSAAMLHIIAHSLYKAHAFLSSGSVIAEANATRTRDADQARSPIGSLAAAAALSASAMVLAAWVFRFNFLEKSGGLTLAFVLLLALTAWLWDVIRTGSRKSAAVGFAVTAALVCLYLGGFRAVDSVVSSSLPTVNTIALSKLAASDVALAFSGLFAIQWLIANRSGREWLAPLQIHASNGFYLDVYFRRVFGSLKSE